MTSMPKCAKRRGFVAGPVAGLGSRGLQTGSSNFRTPGFPLTRHLVVPEFSGPPMAPGFSCPPRPFNCFNQVGSEKKKKKKRSWRRLPEPVRVKQAGLSEF